jgi:hypothetical protein
MNAKHFYGTIFFTAVVFLASALASAMPFSQFDKMAFRDKEDYIEFMVRNAVQIFESEGLSIFAAKVHTLFTETRNPRDQISLERAEFETNLANLRVRNAVNMAQNANATPMQVETAMAVTLNKNGIELNPEFLRQFAQAASSFKPKAQTPR